MIRYISRSVSLSWNSANSHAYEVAKLTLSKDKLFLGFVKEMRLLSVKTPDYRYSGCEILMNPLQLGFRVFRAIRCIHHFFSA